MKIIVQDETGTQTPYEAIPGWSLMEILKEYKLPIKAECGGACCCATCHVYLDTAWIDKVPAMREEEEDMLDSAPNVTAASRLSCQIVMAEELDGLALKIAQEG